MLHAIGRAEVNAKMNSFPPVRATYVVQKWPTLRM